MGKGGSLTTGCCFRPCLLPLSLMLLEHGATTEAGPIAGSVRDSVTATPDSLQTSHLAPLRSPFQPARPSHCRQTLWGA